MAVAVSFLTGTKLVITLSDEDLSAQGSVNRETKRNTNLWILLLWVFRAQDQRA